MEERELMTWTPHDEAKVWVCKTKLGRFSIRRSQIMNDLLVIYRVYFNGQHIASHRTLGAAKVFSQRAYAKQEAHIHGRT